MPRKRRVRKTTKPKRRKAAKPTAKRRPRKTTRRKRAPKSVPPISVKLKLKPKTRKRIARSSILFNFLAVILVLYFGHQAGASDIFSNATNYLSGQISNVRDNFPVFGALKNIPTSQVKTTVKQEPVKPKTVKKTPLPASKKETDKKTAPKITVKKTTPKKVESEKPVVEKKIAPKSKPVVKKEPPKKKVPPPPPKPKVTPKVVTPVKKEPAKKTQTVSSRKPKLIFVIDDIGHTPKHRDLLAKLGDDVTYAILPHLSHSQAYSRLSRKTGAEVILHLPMESSKGTIPGPGLITDRMTSAHMRDMVSRDLKSVPYHVGANNHMGSHGTANRDVMATVLKELKRRKLFFLDSFTTPSSVATSVGRRVGIKVLKRDIFLDNIDEQSHVRQQVRKTADIARQKGHAIAIGHHRHNTLKVLNEEIPRLKREGFQIISLADLIRYQS